MATASPDSATSNGSVAPESQPVRGSSIFDDSEHADSDVDAVDGESGDSDTESFATYLPQYLQTPRFRASEDEFLRDIAKWSGEQHFGIFIERSTKRKGEQNRYQVELRCDRSKRKKPRGYSRKTSTVKTATNCPWKVVLTSNRANNDMWSLRVVNLHHIGHRRSTHWTQHRLLRGHTDEEIQWFEARYTTFAPRQLCELWEREFGYPIRRREVYNWIAKIRRNLRFGYTDTQFFVKQLEERHDIAWSKIEYVEDDTTYSFDGAAWVFQRQLDIWRRLHYCLSIDATYKTNHLLWPMVIVVATTPERTTVPLFQALLYSEDCDSYRWFTTQLHNCLTLHQIPYPHVLITDGDQQLSRGLSADFPDAQLQRCIFHKSKNVIDFIKKWWIRPKVQRELEEVREVPTTASLVNDDEVEADTSDVEDDDIQELRASKAAVHTAVRRREPIGQLAGQIANTRAGLYHLWEHLAYSSTEQVYRAALDRINTQFGTKQRRIVEYIHQEDESRELWAGYLTRQYLNFGARTTSPNESSNGSIKSYGLSSHTSLVDLLAVSRKFVDDRRTAYKESLDSSAERVVMQYIDMAWLGKSPLSLTRYAIELLVDQYQKMLGEVVSGLPRRRRFAKPLPPCTNTFRRQFGLPCAHDLLELYDRGVEVLVDTREIHPFWHLEEHLVCVPE